jgi:hypothetical protein
MISAEPRGALIRPRRRREAAAGRLRALASICNIEYHIEYLLSPYFMGAVRMHLGPKRRCAL